MFGNFTGTVTPRVGVSLANYAPGSGFTGTLQDGQAYSVSVYFETEADAELALAAFEAAGYSGAVVATVETFCLD